MSLREIAIRGGVVCDHRGRRRADLLIRAGKIHAIGGRLTAPETIDASGCFVVPGLVDLHTHLREPGDVLAESVLSGSAAAAMGGYTCITAMPNTNPPLDTVDRVNHVRRLGSKAYIDVEVASCITRGLLGHELVPIADLVQAGVHVFTDEGRGVQDGDVMKQALHESIPLDMLLGAYCLDETIANEGMIHSGPLATALGLPSIDPRSEHVMVERNIDLAEAADKSLHMMGVSSAGSIERIRDAKARGVPLTVEVAPHHLFLSDSALSSLNPVYKVRPPLRSERDRQALVQALHDGTIDVIVTDHAPHSRGSKEVPFESAAFGMIGLETSFAWMLTDSGLGLEDIVEKMSWRPALLAGYRQHGGPIASGGDANLCVIDTEATWKVDRTQFASLSRNSPLHGRTLKGRVRHTIIHGVPVVVDGTLADRPTLL